MKKQCPHCGEQIEVKATVSVGKGKQQKVNIWHTDKPLSLDLFVVKLKKDKRRHINIIANFAEELANWGRPPDCKTYKQWTVWMGIHLKKASELANFDDDQISGAMEEVEKDIKDKKLNYDFNIGTLLKKM